ncbi:MAG TPA: hypothetical protein VH165_27250 [Kofleriaceae bacterium]|nr:hypothetical protein [Kofleriaceae bacterium]
MTACTRCETALEAGDLRCAICALPVPSGPRTGGADAAAPVARVLRCTDCGAAVAFVAQARAPRCGFCGQTMAIEQPVDPIEEARQRVPFTVDRPAAEAAMRGWLAARGWFAPRALSREAVLESLTPLSWAAWRVNATAQVSWTADSDAGAGRSAWAPHAGETELAFRDILVPASRGLIEAECRALIPHYTLAPAVPVAPAGSPSGIAGAPGTSDAVAPGGMPEGMPGMIERFDAQRSAARAYVQNCIAIVARVRVERYIPGRRFRNVRVSCLIARQTTERIALPVWVLAYRYRGAPYRAIVHGQRPAVVLGRSPLDWTKISALVGIALVIAAIIVLIALTK